MNSLQRAWRSTIRKPIKSFLLLLVIVTVSLFILCGMACRNASVQTQDTTRQAVGAGLRLGANETNRSKRLIECSEQIGNGAEGSYGGVHQRKLESVYGTQWQVWTDNSFESLQVADIETIANVPGIADYNITTCTTAVNPVNFRRIEDPDVDQYSDIGGVTLIGNRKMELDFNVLSGNVTIKDGRMVATEDQNVCVISEQLLIEALLIAILAFCIAFALAPSVSEIAADYLVAAQVEQAQIEKDRNADKVMYSHQSGEQTVVGVEVEITDTMHVLCCVGMTVLIVCSIGVAGIPILWKKPREILSELS